MLTIDDEGYVKALMAYSELDSTVQSYGRKLNFTLESKYRTECMLNNIKNSLKDFEDVLIKYEFTDEE